MAKELSILDENWDVLKSFFPPEWEELAHKTGARSRRLRGFVSTEALLRTLLLHVARGYSLRETVVKAKAAELASVSDVALLKRLRNSREWLRELCVLLLAENGIQVPEVADGLRMRMVDATIVKEPGKTGSQWRIHYSLRLPDLHCDHFALTPTCGVGSGESFQQFPVQPGDYIIGDRGYSTAPGVEYLTGQGAYTLVRVNTGALSFVSAREHRFELLPHLARLYEGGALGKWKVFVQGTPPLIPGRLCALRKSEQAIAQAHHKLKQEASKKQLHIQPDTWEYAKYIIVFTTFPTDRFTAADVLEWYRLRWQIELMFKRLKSLAELGHLPKYDEESSQAWLYGKLFVGLLTERLVQTARAISPWGYRLDSRAAS